MSDGFPAWLGVPLLPLSWLYRAGLSVYLAPYRLGVRKRHRLSCRVVSVGNLTFGGTGKSPTVRAICEELLKRGLKPAILSRGHGGKLSSQGAIVSSGTGRRLNAVDCGDEPALLADALPGVPVVIGKDRRRMGRLLCDEFSPDVIVLDDGMQYWQLHRDLEIVLMRADAPFGTGRVLPAGDLREPVGGAGRADVVIVTGAEAVEPARLDEVRGRVHGVAPDAELFTARRRAACIVDGGSGERLPLESLEGMPVVAVSGIAAPDSFERMLKQTGARVLGCVRFRDHCAYSNTEAEMVESVVQSKGARAVVTTAKDAVKLRLSVKIFVLDMKLIVDDMERLIHMVVGKTPEMALKKKTLKKRMELAAGRIALRSLLRLSGRLSPGRIQRWGSVLGNFLFRASSRYRGVATRNLTAAFPDWSPNKVREVARETCRNFARGMLEFFYLLDLPPERVDDWIAIEGREHLDAALEKGHGAIVVTAHLGNWELFARKLALSGYKVNVIARDSDDPGMTGIAKRIRENAGYKVFGRDSAVRPALRCLKRNELLGILPDQNTVSGIFVDFFGRPVATATGPAVFALRTGAPVVCGFARRTPEGKFAATIFPPLAMPETGNEESDIHELTALITRVIEDEIRKDPAQWLWIHDRWRRTGEAPVQSGLLEAHN